MVYKNFTIEMTIRILLLFLILCGLATLLVRPGYQASCLLLFVIAILQSLEISHFVKRTNLELSRFLNALRYHDFSQRFNFQGRGSGFEELGSAFTQIIKQLQIENCQQEQSINYLKALIEHVPVPLISVSPEGAIKLHNSSSKRLLGSEHLTHVSKLGKFGEKFEKAIRLLQTGDRLIVPFVSEKREQTLKINATQITTNGQAEHLISLSNIQTELDTNQLQAWQELARVLSHEIMNSMTPIVSLTKTSVELVDDLILKHNKQSDISGELSDIRSSVNTVARCSDSLITFINNYRKLTQLQQPQKEKIRITKLVDDVLQLVTVNWNAQGILYSTEYESTDYEIEVDSYMLEHILINLLNNAEHALQSVAQPHVSIVVTVNSIGRLIIEISDNGQGVDKNIAKKIFIPFFTTKKNGSGIGLALARQIMNAHGGTITYARNSQGGATFILMF